MKSRKPIIPQHEFSFAAEAFNLAGQSQSAPAVKAPQILAEMSESEREAVREASMHPEPRHVTKARERRAEKQFGPMRGENETPAEFEARTEPKGCAHCGASLTYQVDFCDDDCRTGFAAERGIARPVGSIPGLRAGSSWSVAERRGR